MQQVTRRRTVEGMGCLVVGTALWMGGCNAGGASGSSDDGNAGGTSNEAGAGNLEGSSDAGGTTNEAVASNAGGSGNTTGSTSAGGTDGCTVGDAGCACYPNDTCNQDLQCNAGTCEGASSGATNSGGAASSSTTTEGVGGATSSEGSGATTSGGGNASTAATSTAATSTAATSTAATSTTGATVIGPAILPVDGWVDRTTNTVGIQGSWYTYTDGFSTVVPTTPTFFDGQGTSLCISGNIPSLAVAPDAWGVAMGMDLNLLNQGDAAGQPYNATLYNVTGFQFTVSGTLPEQLQINFPDAGGGEYCMYVSTFGVTQQRITAYFSSATFQCWLGASLPPPDASNLQGFHVQVGPAYDGSVLFDFCLSDIQAVVQ